MYDVVHLTLYLGRKALHRHCIPRRVSLGLPANVRHTVLRPDGSRRCKGYHDSIVPFEDLPQPLHHCYRTGARSPRYRSQYLLGPTAPGTLQDEQTENPQRCVLLWWRTYLDYRTEAGHQNGKHLLGRL